MAKVIMGAHGLANKPERPILTGWWQAAIAEGLRENTAMERAAFEFKMIFWADLLYKKLQHNDELFSFDNLYNSEPYVEAVPGALKSYKEGFLDKVRAGALDVVGETLDVLKVKFDMNAVADLVLGKFLKDLAFYYDDRQQIRNRSSQPETACQVLRDELISAIKEEQDKEIMLIAHSMGSIIAYDALRDLGQSDPEITVSHFVTIGSPLGLPHVKGKIIKERYYDPKVRTPSVVTESWINYADKDDKVAFDVHLRDDYGENSHGVRVVDDLVANDYESPAGKINPHKSYGYLRTPELAEHIGEFLAS